MEKIKNFEKAAQRIRQAVKNNERIILYGDSDMDGIASVVLLQEAIKNLGGNVFMTVFPDRENDGYGINLKALEFLKDKAPALLITLDLGISNMKEIDLANELGFEVIVIDHHAILERIPNASIVVDPQQKGDEYSFKGLCNGGLTFKFCKEILGDNISEQLENNLLELAALATIADMVPQVQENKMFIEKGLRSLKNTFRPGLRAFIDILGEGEVAAGGYMKIISALNAAESVDFQNESYELLTSSDAATCRELAEKLLAKVQLKQQKIKEIVSEIERRVAKNPDSPIVFEGDPAWKLMLAGHVASIISQKYGKPTFIFKKGDTESCGSVRTIRDEDNSVETMKTCSDLLITYGGHPRASGFRLKNENLERFKNSLEQYFLAHK